MEKDTKTFEGALSRLEEIVRLLESPNAPLDELLSLFEEGTGLVKQCTNQLDTAEQKIKILVEKDGVIDEQPFKSTEN